MKPDDVLKKIKQRVAEAAEMPWADGAMVKIPPEHLSKAAACVRDELGYDMLLSLTAVDWSAEDRLELVCLFVPTGDPSARLCVKVDLKRAVGAAVSSLAPLYAGADWQEREVYDLFGVRFEGHPALRRILLWEGYAGHPLRKDYVHTPDRYDSGEELGIQSGDKK